MRFKPSFNTGLAIGYFILLILAVPWYWPADEARLLYGLPVWALTAILVGLAAACLTAWVLVCRPWPEVGDQEDPQ